LAAARSLIGFIDNVGVVFSEERRMIRGGRDIPNGIAVKIGP
jgi:hypothetical protein